MNVDTPEDISAATPTMAGRLLRGLLYCGLAGSLFLFGGVHEAVFHASSFLLILACLLAFLLRPASRSMTRPIAGAIGLGGMLVVLGLVQALASWRALAAMPPGIPPFSPVFMGLIPPHTILETVYRALAPLAAFLASLILHRRPAVAHGFLRTATLAGGVAILLTLLQFALLPQYLLLAEKLHYRENFTAFFVNRNTAATFCGLVLASSLCLLALHREQARSIARLPDPRQMTRREIMLWVTAFGALVGLALTQSRAGVLATGLGLIPVTLAWFRAIQQARRGTWGSRWSWLILAAGAVLVLGMVFERVLLRFEATGLSSMRWCMYDTMLDLAWQRPWLGFGLGGFETLASVYRRPECGIHGGWEYLHSFFLEAFLSGGLALLALILATMVLLGRTLWLGARHPGSRRFLAVLGGATTMIVVVHSALDFSIQIAGIANLLAVILGCVWASILGPHQKRSDEFRVHGNA